MPAAALARSPAAQISVEARHRALDRALAELFRGLQTDPAPTSLVRLADRLEEGCRRARTGPEARSIA